MSNLIPVNNDNKVSARGLYDFLELAAGQFSRWSKSNILENQFAVENEDYIGFDINVEGNVVRDFNLSIQFAKKLCMISKSEKGEAARNYFIAVEERLKTLSKPMCLEDILITQLQEMKNIKSQLTAVTVSVNENKQELQNIRDVIVLDPNSWRPDTTKIINSIARNLGGNEHIRDVRKEAYDLLNTRMGVDLQARLTNKRRRMADEGVCKSKRDKLNYMDVIADDKKLIEGFVSIIKQMAVKYGVAA